ncbi:hypothetical protein COH21_003670 [Aspergillus flavus]|uniref:Uncharacterized protein n=1 Tax=Aspergillus flavus TaxID=5059 RepID=A0AB74BVY6_ASPFL|nr:hypothetical protein COH21_003670 [Aspergillus flavus]RMZ37081.1 hypothetical protein CA14_006332 [Aspergillus flavus]
MFASVLGPSSSRSAAQESGQPKALQASPVHIPSTGPEQQLPLPVTAPPGLETTGSVFVFQETVRQVRSSFLLRLQDYIIRYSFVAVFGNPTSKQMVHSEYLIASASVAWGGICTGSGHSLVLVSG